MVWKSSDESIATVSNGIVHTLKPGTVTITAEPRINYIRGSCTVTVLSTDPNEIIEVSVDVDGYDTMGVSQQKQCFATVIPDTAPDKSNPHIQR